MTTTHQKFAHARTRISLLVLVLSLLTAASAAAAPPAATAPVAPTVAGTDPATAPAAAPDPAPAATSPAPATSAAPAPATPSPAGAGSTGGAPSDPPASPESAASPLATEPVTQRPTPGDATLQPQQVVIAAGSATTPIDHPSHDQAGPPAGHAALDQPVVSTTRPTAPAVRATVTQLASGGPFVAASSSAPEPATQRPAHGAGVQAQPVIIADGSAAPRGAAAS
ncbi:MAG: hypothetical protein LC720_06925 [Actinobacteria bacterium]|nr:hypothetical protein [Actinomycetota bacterium]